MRFECDWGIRFNSKEARTSLLVGHLSEPSDTTSYLQSESPSLPLPLSLPRKLYKLYRLPTYLSTSGLKQSRYSGYSKTKCECDLILFTLPEPNCYLYAGGTGTSPNNPFLGDHSHPSPFGLPGCLPFIPT